MITISFWQLLGVMFAVGFVCFLLGVVAMACMAMAGYDGDEKRSEPE